MTEPHRATWGPPRTDPQPRALNEAGGLDFLYQHCADLLGCDLVISSGPDVSGATRYTAAWFDERDVKIAWVSGSARDVARHLDHFAAVARQVSGQAIDPPSLED